MYASTKRNILSTTYIPPSRQGYFLYIVQWLCNHRNISIARWSDICHIDTVFLSVFYTCAEYHYEIFNGIYVNVYIHHFVISVLYKWLPQWQHRESHLLRIASRGATVVGTLNKTYVHNTQRGRYRGSLQSRDILNWQKGLQWTKHSLHWILSDLLRNFANSRHRDEIKRIRKRLQSITLTYFPTSNPHLTHTPVWRWSSPWGAGTRGCPAAGRGCPCSSVSDRKWHHRMCLSNTGSDITKEGP